MSFDELCVTPLGTAASAIQYVCTKKKNENSEAIRKPKCLHPNHRAFSVTVLYPGNEWMAYFSDCAQHISYCTATSIPIISAATYICHF